MRTYGDFLLGEGRQAQARADRKANPNQVKRDKQAGQEARRQEANRPPGVDPKYKKSDSNTTAVPQGKGTSASYQGDSKEKGGALVPTRKPQSRPAPNTSARRPENKPGTGSGSSAAEFKRTKAQGKGLERGRQKELERRRLQKIDDAGAKDRLEKRKSGVGSGIKSALGGDVIGVRAKAGESDKDKELRKDANAKARGDFAKKKVQQTGNLAKSTARGALNLGKSALANKPEGATASGEAGNQEGSSEIIRGKRG